MPDEIDLTAAACIASTRAQIEAETTTSDQGVPPKVLMLARRCGESTDYPVLAIVQHSGAHYEPAGPVENLLLWHADRLEGKPGLDPPVLKVEYTAWCFVLDAHREDRSPCNAAVVEAWLREEGYQHARAIAPNVVEVCGV
jgi:hypothetical protein